MSYTEQETISTENGRTVRRVVLTVPASECAAVQALLDGDERDESKDGTMLECYTAHFSNGFFVDIQVINEGSDYRSDEDDEDDNGGEMEPDESEDDLDDGESGAYLNIVMFGPHGGEIDFVEPDYNFIGYVEFEYDGDESNSGKYVVEVVSDQATAEGAAA